MTAENSQGRPWAECLREGVDDIAEAAGNMLECAGFNRSAGHPVTYEDMETAVTTLAGVADRYYMKLPTDADGKPIRPGDTLRLAHNGRTMEVRSVEYFGGDVWNVWPVTGGGPVTLPDDRHRVTHTDPRTVENVIIDAMQYGFNSQAGTNVSAKGKELSDEIHGILGYAG